MKWKEEKRGDKIIASTTRIGCFKLVVHRYVGYGDIWLISCYGIFDKVNIGNISLNKAQDMAAAKLKIVLEEAIDAITN